MNIAINGFGRIGRTFIKLALKKGLNVLVINDLADPATLAHLLKYDSVHGPISETISHDTNHIYISHHKVLVLAEKDPSALPWKELKIDVVLESTGKFTTRIGAQKHLNAGAKQVILSAPSADKDIPTVVMGVNDSEVNFQESILSNASCTTNNVAPLIKLLDKYWGIEDGYITTVHSMTGDQNLHDAPHKDLRRARAASSSIIPTSTGAAKAITTIFPHLVGRLGGAGIRVPVLNGSLTDFTCTLRQKPTISEINEIFNKHASTDMQSILLYTEDPIVSVDILNSPYSCVFDAGLTSIVGELVKVVGWYDNESGYSNRLVDLLIKIKTNYG
ncbi:MAG: type I glyceraldehyde-3-phosphate dehydrogenase [Pedobacter sp.]|nr:MAG: type I glyceraldehyde-3-phosphate dehydrogenase [Pedobacter sp.]